MSAVTNEKSRKASGPPSGGERRARERSAPSSGDWESIALRRVARRVQSLGTEEQASEPAESPEFGWEDAALRNLRRRLKDDPG